MDEDCPACTKEKPLDLDFRALCYLFSVADEAGKLLDAILNQKPIAEPARQLAVDLYELEMSILYGPEFYWSYAEAFLETQFTHGEFDVENSRLTGLRLWAEKSDPEKPDPPL